MVGSQQQVPRVVRVSGTPEQAGRAYGAECADLIHGQLRAWDEESARRGVRLADLVADLGGRAGFRQSARRWAPHLLDEVDAVAAGAGVSQDEAFALNCLDEAWWWGESGAGCSVVAASRPGDADGRPLGAQNMDLDAWMDGGQVVLVREGSDRPDVAVLTRAGMLALCGANGAGLVVLVNTLPQLPVDRDGLPVAFVTRLVLDCADVAEASDLLRRLPHATGQAYTLLDGSGASAGLECGAGVVRDYGPSGGAVLLHTNHPVADLPTPVAAGIGGGTAVGTGPATETISDSSVDRLAILGAARPDLDDEGAVVRVLADPVAGVCVAPGRWGRAEWATFGSVLVRPGPPTRVRVTAGAADHPPVELTLTAPTGSPGSPG